MRRLICQLGVATRGTVMSLTGVITLILIAILAMPLLQFSLNLSVIPPDDYADADKGYQA